MKKQNAIFANFICRFGDDKVLLDYAEQIVIPAFTNNAHVRSYGEQTHYRFYDVELLNVPNGGSSPTTVLAGRIIKNTELTRHQVLNDQEDLIKDEQSMRSSPSAFFVLILNNHRLIYFRETPNAPEINTFKATAQQFLLKSYEQHVQQLYEISRRSQNRLSKRFLYETHPRPSLDVVLLTRKSDISNFLKKFQVINKIDFVVIKPNDGINAGEILEEVRKLAEDLKSTNTKVTASNSDGLNLEAATNAVTNATASGNQDVHVRGKDFKGKPLSGNNAAFKIDTMISDIPNTKKGLIIRLLKKYKQLSDAGSITEPFEDKKIPRISELAKPL